MSVDGRGAIAILYGAFCNGFVNTLPALQAAFRYEFLGNDSAGRFAESLGLKSATIAVFDIRL